LCACSKYIVPADYMCLKWNWPLPLQVFTFGSVPLKTYLPDGDIDVTAFSNSDELKDTWANLVRDALEHEEKNETAELCVKEVQYIQAEVVFLWHVRHHISFSVYTWLML
jgi:DNA polymerase sigma